MRPLLFLALLSISPLSFLHSQIEIELQPPYLLIDTEVPTLADDFYFEFVTDQIIIENTGSDTIDLRWTILDPIDSPAAWEVRGNDEFQSYPTMVTSNYPWGSELILEPGASTLFYMSLLPRHTPGCGSYVIEFLDNNNPDIELPAATFEFRVNDSDCLITAIHEPGERLITIYPNPASNTLWIDGYEGTSIEFTVFDLAGKALITRKLSGDQIDISTLDPALYIVQLSDPEKNITQTFRFIKTK